MRFRVVPLALLSLLLAGTAIAGPKKWTRADRRHAMRPQLPAEVLEARSAAKATAIAEAHRIASAAATPLPVWKSLGPTSGRGGGNDPAEADSGRLSTIIPDPVDTNTLYVAESGGGVWKCTNADPASDNWVWTPLTDELPSASSDGSIAVGAIAMDPADHLTLYVGMGDRYIIGPSSQGLYVTHDGGATFTRLAGTIGGSGHVRDIRVIGSTLWVSADTGLWTSANGGTSFTAVTLPGLASYESWQIKDLAGTRIVVAVQAHGPGGFGGAGHLYVSSNSGTSFTETVPTGAPGSIGRIAFDLAAGTPDQGYAFYEDLADANDAPARGVLHSNDGGLTWAYVAAPAAADGLFQATGGDGGGAFYSLAISIDPAQPTHLFGGANLAMYRSQDGGATWHAISEWYSQNFLYSHADVHAMAWSAAGVLYVGNDGGLSIFPDPERATIPTFAATTTDFTFIDNRHNKGLVTHLIYAMGNTAATGKQNLISLGMQDNGTMIRELNGAAGTGIFDENTGGDGFGTVISPKDGNLMLTTTYYGYVYRSVDGGVSFDGGSQAFNGSEDFYNNLRPGFADATGKTVFHNSLNGLFRTTDFGITWTTFPYHGTAGTLKNLATSHTHGNVVAVVGDTGAPGSVTYDGGANWTNFGALANSNPAFNPQVASAIDPDHPIAPFDTTTGVWIDSLDDHRIYVTSEWIDAAANHVYASVDGGKTFKALDGTAAASNGYPFGIAAYSIANDPRSSEVLYVGTDVGIYWSIDAGKNWERYGDKLPWVAVRDVYVAPDASVIRAATYGRGVWESPMVEIPLPPPVAKKKGCACTVDGATPTAASIALAGMLALGAVLVRRRRS